MKKKALKEKINELEGIIDNYVRQNHFLKLANNDLKTKASTELWSLKDFLEKMGKDVEKAANEYLSEPGSLRVKILPIENVDGYPLAGYRSEVTAESFSYGDKDLEISLLRKENADLKEKLLLAVKDDATN